MEIKSVLIKSNKEKTNDQITEEITMVIYKIISFNDANNCWEIGRTNNDKGLLKKGLQELYRCAKYGNVAAKEKIVRLFNSYAKYIKK